MFNEENGIGVSQLIHFDYWSEWALKRGGESLKLEICSLLLLIDMLVFREND